MLFLCCHLSNRAVGMEMLDLIEKGKSKKKKINQLVEEKQAKKINHLQPILFSVKNVVLILPIFFCRRSLEGFMLFPDQYKRHYIS